MLVIRKASDRGVTNIEWLDSKHTFSFGSYFDKQHMGFGVLRVINEDVVKPGAGFGAHSHSNMEIISYVLEGALSHKDSLGTGSVILPGDVQRMSAGTGIVHSEFNFHKDKPVHFLQIWILPQQANIPPSYEQKNFSANRQPGKLTLVASADGSEDSLLIHQDLSMYVLDLDTAQTFSYPVKNERMLWIQIARGSIKLNTENLIQGEGVAVKNENELIFSGIEKSEILIFEMNKT